MPEARKSKQWRHKIKSCSGRMPKEDCPFSWRLTHGLIEDIPLGARLLSGPWAGHGGTGAAAGTACLVCPRPTPPSSCPVVGSCAPLPSSHCTLCSRFSSKKPAESHSPFIVSLASSCQRPSAQQGLPAPELAGAGTTSTHVPHWEWASHHRAASPGAARVFPRLQETGLQSTCAFLYEKMPITFWEEQSSKDSCTGFTQAPTVRISSFFFFSENLLNLQ